MSSPSNDGTSSTVRGGTGAATRQANSDASKSVIARVPLQPRLTCCQKRSRPMPYGDTTPMPEITMRGSMCPAYDMGAGVPVDRRRAVRALAGHLRLVVLHHVGRPGNR